MNLNYNRKTNRYIMTKSTRPMSPPIILMDTKLWFGKFLGQTPNNLLSTEEGKQYMKWIYKNLVELKFDESVIKKILSN